MCEMTPSESAAETVMQKNLEQIGLNLFRMQRKITEQDLGSQSLIPRNGQGSTRRAPEEESL